jgi:Arylsulfotransferase (ASST)
MRARGIPIPARALVLGSALASVNACGVAFASTPSALELSLHRAEVSGRLSLSASSTSAKTTVTVKGLLDARTKGRLVIMRCSEIKCAHRVHVTTDTIHHGRHKLNAIRVMTHSVAVRLQLLIGRFHDTIDLTAYAPKPATRTAPTAPLAPQSTPTPAATLQLTASPGLNPAYNPAVPDYTVACEPAGAVDVQATVPGGQTLSINGSTALSGSVSQTIPLQAGQVFTFTVTDASGSSTHNVRCTPADFPAWTVERNGTPDVSWIALIPPGGGPFAVLTDNWGVPVWWMRSPSGSIQNASVLPSGNVAWWNAGDPNGDGEEGYYSIYNLDGNLVSDVTAATSDGHGEIGANLHDFEELPNGDYLLLAYVPVSGVDLEPYVDNNDATVLDAVIQEVSPTGELLWSWDSDGTLDRDGSYTTGAAISLDETDWGFAGSPTTWNGQPAYDVIHMNSIQELDAGNCVSTMTCNIVFSARHLDAVYSISMATGTINWKLGGTRVAGESLEFVNDPYGNFSGNHFARILPNGNLTIHDNGTLASRPPRAAQYAIDTANDTATLVSQVTDPRESYSGCCGSATLMPGGDWLISWGDGSTVTELTPGGSPVLTLSFPSGFSYRAYDVTSNQIDRDALINGMNTMYSLPSTATFHPVSKREP